MISSSPRKWRVARGWYALLAALLAYCVLSSIDQHFKRAPHAGFRPDGASCTAYTSDLPRAWSALERIPAAKAIQEELPYWTHQAELAVRLATGIRPEPERWRVWFGTQVLASVKDGQWGLCVHPGLLLRAAHGLNRLFSAASDDGLYTYRGLHYAWRDHFLVASPWPEYVRAALRAAPCADTGSETRPDGISLTWSAPYPGDALILPEESGLRGHLALQTPHAKEALRLPNAWPGTPLITLSARNLDIPRALWDRFSSTPAAVRLQQYAGPLLRAWSFPALPEAWDTALSELSFALYNIDLSENTPLPEMALALRAPSSAYTAHPLEAILANDHPIAYAWDTHPGQILPILGEKFSLCLAGGEGLWLTTTQEPLMARLLGHLSLSPANASTATLRLDCAKTGDVIANLLRRAAALELLPGMDPRDLEHEWIPFTRAFSRLGHFTFDASSDGGKLLFFAKLEGEHHE